MTELDWLMRTLSSITRLRIYALILHRPPDTRGLRPWEIARLLGIRRPLVSFHLKFLLRAGLVRYWKKGIRKSYRPASYRPGSMRDRLSLMVRTQVSRDFALSPAARSGSPSLTPEQRRRGVEHTVPPHSPLEPLWLALTCFSHFRRLLMLRHLLSHASASVGTLERVMDLHPQTVEYHADKLLRRAALVRTGGGYAIAPRQPTTLQADVWREVCAVLAKIPHPVERG